MRKLCVALALTCLGVVNLGASDRTGVYAVVDKVVFEPSADKPERVQVWGAFAIATRTDRDNYEPVQRGYLYFTAGDPRLTRAEWNDLKAVAGSGKIVAFGSRLGQSVRVRKQDEQPQTPDRYATDAGIRVIPRDRDYAPIKALAAQIATR